MLTHGAANIIAWMHAAALPGEGLSARLGLQGRMGEGAHTLAVGKQGGARDTGCTGRASHSPQSRMQAQLSYRNSAPNSSAQAAFAANAKGLATRARRAVTPEVPLLNVLAA